jgi:hypothetical protein
MKTTVDISDSLLARAREVAARRGLTLRALIEEGLHHAIKGHRRRAPFTLRSVAFSGEGLDPAFAEGGFDRVRDAVYTGRGA